MALRPTTTRGGEAAAAILTYPRVPLDPVTTAFGRDEANARYPGFPDEARRRGSVTSKRAAAGVIRPDTPDTTTGSAVGIVAPYASPPPQDSIRPADATPVAQAPPDADAGVGKTVLMAEDDAVVRMVVADVLRDLGYRVLEASDGLAALDVVRSEERLDLLLTDLRLPGLDGRRLAEAARRLRPGLRVLFVTGEIGDAAGQDALPPGTEVVGKPIALDALAAKVRAMLAA